MNRADLCCLMPADRRMHVFMQRVHRREGCLPRLCPPSSLDKGLWSNLPAWIACWGHSLCWGIATSCRYCLLLEDRGSICVPVCMARLLQGDQLVAPAATLHLSLVQAVTCGGLAAKLGWPI